MLKLKKNSNFKNWIITDYAGKGGNGIVYFAKEKSASEEIAIKFLINPKNEPYKRFKNEVLCQEKLSKKIKVLPVLDYYLPNNPLKNNLPWFAMPRAIPLNEKKLETFRDTVLFMKEILEVLSSMHHLCYSHRDIKPENIFFYKNSWTLGDFGLIDFPEKETLTLENKKLGPMFYIAPEMLNNPRKSDGKKADIYSLAKLFWKLNSGLPYPLPGTHRCNVPALTLSAYTKDQRAFLLDGLIDRCTALIPDTRPSASDFLTELTSWLSPKEFKMENLDIPDMTDLIKLIKDRNAAAEEDSKLQQNDMEYLGKYIRDELNSIGENFAKISGLNIINNSNGLNPLGYFEEYNALDFRKQISRQGAGFSLLIHGDRNQDRIEVDFCASQIENDIYCAILICLCDDGLSQPRNVHQLYYNTRKFKANKVAIENFVKEYSKDVKLNVASGLPKLRKRIMQKYRI